MYHSMQIYIKHHSGKRADQSLTAATATGLHKSHLFHVVEGTSGLRFLVDTGAQVSVIPPTPQEQHSPQSIPFSLQTANNSTIKTFGEKLLSLNLGLRRSFSWIFIIADVHTPILGVDFLTKFHLLVDGANQKLVDTTTNIFSTYQPIDSIIYAIQIENSTPDDRFRKILESYPKLLRPTYDATDIKHSVIHHITTTGSPVFSLPKRLAPDKLAVSNAEFEHMLQLGIIRHSNSSWASPLHMVSKKQGDWRPCGDYRPLNNITEPERYIV